MKFLISVILAWVLSVLPGYAAPAVPASGAAPAAATALVQVVDPVTGADAQTTPLTAPAGQPFRFALRISDAGDQAKAAWEIQVGVPTCLFETPAPSAVAYGSFLDVATVISIAPTVKVEANQTRIHFGQFSLNGGTLASTGTLALITLTPRRTPACAEPPANPALIELGGVRLATEGGQELEVQTTNGLVTITAPATQLTFLPFVMKQ